MRKTRKKTGKPKRTRKKRAVKDHYDPTARPLGELLLEIGNKIPEEELDKLPRDFAEHAEHYMYGAPKRNEAGVSGGAMPRTRKKTRKASKTKKKPAVNDRYDPTARPIWEILVEIGNQIPEEELAKLPRDFGRYAKHYMYGAPKE